MGQYHLNVTAQGNVNGKEVTVEAENLAEAIQIAEKDARGWKVIRGTGPRRKKTEAEVQAWIAAYQPK